ncbi:hypothetical protein CYMTET_27759 [Cymbomonas tetramitiformis]|uniref:Uncharacterized protein n=1 Tax=Cymbomonas tetramitiformis TaxID=36881 RepID=A0AAE0KWL3_9CHLO|nr:hypothetical protein CYMTET_27759 [Cymbomonas tetramitiformis]
MKVSAYRGSVITADVSKIVSTRQSVAANVAVGKTPVRLSRSQFRGSSVGRVQLFATRYTNQRRNNTAITCADAAAAGAPAPDDPYQILGVNPIMGSDKIMGAYNRKLKKMTAEGASEEELAVIEGAYNSILMKQLTARKAGQSYGGLGVSDSLKFADKLSWYQQIPWRPKKSISEKRDIGINGIVLSVLLAWALLSPVPGVQPMTFGSLAFFFRLFQKLHKLNPSPANREDPQKKKQDNAKFGRAVCLTMGALFAAVILVVWIPITVAEVFKLKIPGILLTAQSTFVNVSTLFSMFLMSSLFR